MVITISDFVSVAEEAEIRYFFGNPATESIVDYCSDVGMMRRRIGKCKRDVLVATKTKSEQWQRGKPT